MKWSYSTITPSLAKVPGVTGKRDLGLGAYGATTPGSYQTSQAPAPTGPVLSAPAFAPDFLSSAVNDLNEGQQLQAAMHADWRNTLLSAIQKGDSSLVPALTAASLSPGAKLSYAGGGAPVQQTRQPSYWEQKLALKDVAAAQEAKKQAEEQQRLLGSGLGTFMSPQDVQTQQGIYANDALKASQQEDLARRVLGIAPTGGAMARGAQNAVNAREMEARQKYYTGLGWQQRSSLMAPEVLQASGW